MCGIFACISCQEQVVKKLSTNELLLDLLHRRGPNHFGSEDIKISSDLHLNLSSSTLQLRGEKWCRQPLTDQDNNVLQWNGQIFDGEIAVSDHESDTKILLSLLTKTNGQIEPFLKIFSKIKGPWAFTFWDNKFQRLWFGRDIFGRRSLCWNTNRSSELFVISTLAFEASIDGQNLISWQEIPADGIYCLDLSATAKIDFVDNLRHFPWNTRISGQTRESNSFLFLESPISVPLNDSSIFDENLFQNIPDQVVDEFIRILGASVEKRCLNQQNLCKNCFVRLTNEVATHDDGTDSEGDTIGNGKLFDKDFERRRCTHTSTAVLFSGGLDSTILALLADQSIDNSLPIDLLNVAFDNEAPDRETGLSAWNELKQLRPDRVWNFVSIYISKEELQSLRNKRVKHLVKPSHTVLDDSIGCALWFAAQGKGLLLDDTSEAYSYTTPARVVLLGMGADEQLGGYSRHRRVFDTEGWSGLIRELAVEIDRISSRNLGRDDRVVSDHGMEPRYPFLDENVVTFLNGLPVWHKCNLKLDRAAGEKLLLRKVAQSLGLQKTAHHLKRAIQFGSRIAKIEENKEKGNDVCSRLY